MCHNNVTFLVVCCPFTAPPSAVRGFAGYSNFSFQLGGCPGVTRPLILTQRSVFKYRIQIETSLRSELCLAFTPSDSRVLPSAVTMHQKYSPNTSTATDKENVSVRKKWKGTRIRTVIRLRGDVECDGVIVTQKEDGDSVALFGDKDKNTYMFDRVLGPKATQKDVYDAVIRKFVAASLCMIFWARSGLL
uniref:Kinesin motor domain-containing protein n=2 Tax=Panagrellus redivivus TaxID=6233 RepID=A0A7E4VJN9_PANRE